MPLKRDASDLSHVALVSLISSSSLHRSRFVRCPVSVKLLEPHYIVYDSDTLDSNFTLQTNSSTDPQTNTPFPIPRVSCCDSNDRSQVCKVRSSAVERRAFSWLQRVMHALAPPVPIG